MDKNNRKNITDAQVEMLDCVEKVKSSSEMFFTMLDNVSAQYGLNRVMVNPFPVAGGWLVKSFYCVDNANDNEQLLLHGVFKGNGVCAIATNLQDDRIEWLDDFVLQMLDATL